MLFAYEYVPHDMDNLQYFLDFIFYDVWCVAPESGYFRIELFDGNEKVKNFMKKLYYDHTASGDFFYSNVENIYGIFATLSSDKICQIKEWYNGNNDIENACANNQGHEIVHYAGLKQYHLALGEALEHFFTKLWGHSLLDLKYVTETVSTIDSHYKAFTAQNKKNICPFCGLSRMDDAFNDRREDYDHFLPKSLYPFNSLNFKNLVPTCLKCNRTRKLAKDPLHTGNTRRKAFYAFSANHPQLTVMIHLGHADIDQLMPDDIELSFLPTAVHEEIMTWRDIYDIDRRYKALCCGAEKNEWLLQVLDEWRWHPKDQQDIGRTPDEFMEALNRDCARNPHTDNRFLKRAFLEACKSMGLFNAPPSAS